MNGRWIGWALVAAVGCSGGENDSPTGFGSGPSAPTTMPPVTTEGETTGGSPTEGPTTGAVSVSETSADPSGTTAVDPTADTSTGGTTGAVDTGSESTGETGSAASTGGAPVCGDAVVEGPEACDDGNDDETDACLSTCAAASCGDGFVHAGVEACDGGAVTNGACSAMCALTCNQGFADCNGVAGDGCEVDTQADEANCGGCGKPCAANQTCTASQCVGGMQEFGPEHNFVGLQSNHFITQGCCSTGCQPNEAGMADYFCKHFYNAQCTAKPGYFTAQTPFPEYPKMHKRDGCTSNGSDIPNTQCDGGPCKIGNWSESTSGLTNLVCVCP